MEDRGLSRFWVLFGLQHRYIHDKNRNVEYIHYDHPLTLPFFLSPKYILLIRTNQQLQVTGCTPTPHPQLKATHSTNAATAPNPATNPPTTTRPAALEGLVRTPVPVGATEGLNGPFGVAVAIATDVTGNTPVGTAPLTPGVTERNCVELTSAPGGAVLGA